MYILSFCRKQIYAYFDSEKVIILSVGYVQVANMAIEWDDKSESSYEEYQKDGMTDLENEYKKEVDEMRDEAEKDIDNLKKTFNRGLLLFILVPILCWLCAMCILCCLFFCYETHARQKRKHKREEAKKSGDYQ